MVKPLDKKEIKQEKVEKSIKKEEETEKVKIVDPIKEELPQKVSPESKSTSSKPNAKKNGKNQPVTQGKGSISSFFSKPSNKSSTVRQSTSSESTNIKKEPEIKIEMKEEVSRKRSASPEIQKKESVKKVPTKKLKLKDPQNKKRSRIQVMEDSSEEEEDEPQTEDLPDSKFIKFDREMTPEKQPVRSPKEMDVDDEEVVECKKEETKQAHKNKAKRWVTKRFETDDGFIRTEKVLEEYSDDDNENENENGNENENNDDNIKKNSHSSQEKIESPTKKTPQKKVTPKTKVKDMPKAKQGSIMNFFSKK